MSYRFFTYFRPLIALSAVLTANILCAQPATPEQNQRGASSPAIANGTPPRIPGAGPGRPEPFPEARSIPQPKDDNELAAAVKQLGAQLETSGRFSGSVLVTNGDKPLIRSAWGEADREHKVANKPETSFDVGSIGKLFTQVAVLQLVEAHKLVLDEPFGKYLTDYPNRDIAGKVTIRQLLLHTSGMGDIFDSITPQTDLSSMRQLKDMLPLFAEKPLEFAPGSETRYSNAGYIVLGLVVEAVSGTDYYSYVQEHVIKPAGMAHSGFFDRTALPSGVARSYEDGRDVTNRHLVRGSPAGGLRASADDLLALVQAINHGKLLQADSVKVLRDLIPHPPNAPAPTDPTRLTGYGIAGGAPGVSALVAIDPAGRYTRIVLCNGSPPMAMSMAATIGEWIKQMPPR